MIRKLKLDELLQLVNVFIGDMSLVGPRPQVKSFAELYTEEERKVFTVKPGITDLASIVFSDLADILKGQPDPDLAYDQLVRPWKSRLALFGMAVMSPRTYVEVVLLTLLSALNRPAALKGVQNILRRHGASPDLVAFAARNSPLVPTLPPGSSESTSLAVVATASPTGDADASLRSK